MVILYYRGNSDPNDVFIAFKNLDVKGAPARDSEVARDVTIPALEASSGSFSAWSLLKIWMSFLGAPY
jgi:hypothetical protein